MTGQGEVVRTPNEKRTGVFFWLLAFVFLLFGLAIDLSWRLGPELLSGRPFDPSLELTSPIELASLPTATRFDFPIGSEHGAMAYNAQPFTQNNHLGDDLNGIGGENSDLGDPIYAIADGRVLLARDGGPGWGNVVIILHAYREGGARKYVQSYYAHMQAILVRPGELVRRGEEIATVGTGNGRYLAHLHFEMREFITPFIGPGYRKDTRGWINPSEFIRAHRGAPDAEIGRVEGPGRSVSPP
ncbi:MAG TPA: M23 family metallopeptidase [Chthoniobacterales bacterium]|jgi:murein DD-endopeptidase MepM/ murein hydrolase activator NlpD